MLTIFSTPKPFQGHIGVIQRNAIESWLQLSPGIEVILFGDDSGAAEAGRDFGIRHVKSIELHPSGAPCLQSIFAQVQTFARHEMACYINCDIVLMRDFLIALQQVSSWRKRFLMVGRRWDTPVTRPLDFQDPDWERRLRGFAMRSGKQQLPYAVDYFVFSRGLYADMPPFAVGRTYWDHWMVWKARYDGVPVVDVSAGVRAIHQNHDYSHHPAGREGVSTGSESRRNRALAGGQLHLYTIEHATHQLVDGRIEDKPGSWHVPMTFLLRLYSSQVWYWLLKSTFRFRHALGLHRRSLVELRHRVRSSLGE